MTAVKKKTNNRRPKKPHPDYPLFPHQQGYWAKKIRGKHHYFGPWNDPEGALKHYLAEKDDLLAGRKPRPHDPDAITVRELCNTVLTDKDLLVADGSLTEQHFADLVKTSNNVVKQLGPQRRVDDLRADDFAQLRSQLVKKWAPTTVRGEIARIKSLFNYASKTGIVDFAVKGLQALQAPTKKALRKHRNKSPKKLFSREAILALLQAAPNPMRAFVLLGINCGFGNRDCGMVPASAFDLDRGWVLFPRTKNEIERRCPLWPETVEAVLAGMQARPEPKTPEYIERAFLTAKGGSWSPDQANSPVASSFAKLQKSVGTYQKNVGFYSLRHTFRTVADACLDPNAVRTIMGHTDQSIDAVYIEEVSDDRLIRVSRHIHDWLWQK